MASSPRPSGLLGTLMARVKSLDARLARATLARFEQHVADNRPPTPRVRAADEAMLRRALRPERRPLVEHHWATWCTSCVEELPRVAELVERVSDNADVVAVSWDMFQGHESIDDAIAEVEQMASRHGFLVPTLVADVEPETLFSALGLSFHQIPQTRILDADGGVFRVFEGPLSDEDIDTIDSLVRPVG
jgi:thiol-disulfide isomerase/thioredoxin